MLIPSESSNVIFFGMYVWFADWSSMSMFSDSPSTTNKPIAVIIIAAVIIPPRIALRIKADVGSVIICLSGKYDRKEGTHKYYDFNDWNDFAHLINSAHKWDRVAYK